MGAATACTAVTVGDGEAGGAVATVDVGEGSGELDGVGGAAVGVAGAAVANATRAVGAGGVVVADVPPGAWTPSPAQALSKSKSVHASETRKRGNVNPSNVKSQDISWDSRYARSTPNANAAMDYESQKRARARHTRIRIAIGWSPVSAAISAQTT